MLSAALAQAQAAGDREAEGRIIPQILRTIRPRHKGNQNDKRSSVDRFYAKVAWGTSDCWYWWGYLNPDGYGCESVGGVMMHAHRASWLLHKGPIPHGKYVLHHCDVRNCVNPEHLYLGTQADNMRDMHGRERWTANPYHGAAHCNSKLTWEQVAEMRAAYAAGNVSMAALGRRYGIGGPTVFRIVRGKSWTKQ